MGQAGHASRLQIVESTFDFGSRLSFRIPSNSVQVSKGSPLRLSDSSAFTYPIVGNLSCFLSLQAMAVSKEHCDLIEKVGEYADAQWKEHGPFIAGQKGYDAMRYQGVKMSHPDFPIFSYSLGALPCMSNGIRVNLWGTPDPLCIAMTNINHSQTRKSRLNALSESLIGPVDELCTQRMEYIYEHKIKASEAINAPKKRRIADEAPVEGQGNAQPAAQPNGEDQAGDAESKGPVFPGLWSIAFLGGTLERVKERCAGDFSFVKQTKYVSKLPPISTDYAAREMQDLNEAEKSIAFQSGMKGRPNFGNGLLYDEIYGLLQDLSILDKPTDKKTGDGNFAGQTPNAGWFNRLVQCGKSDHETKSCGSHGGLNCMPVSTSLLGNFHVTPAIEMVRGERGDHGCQAKARIMVTTGLPVQPHQKVEAFGELEVKQTWVEIPEEILELVGIKDAVQNVHKFRTFFNDGAEEEEMDAFASQGNGGHLAFVPDEHGYSHELPDGVAIDVRLKLVVNEYKPEWSIPERDIKIPDEYDIVKHVPAYVENCARTPHREVDLDDEAKGAFLSYSVFYNVLVKKSRDEKDADGGAENGIGPWKLGMLACALLLWDILWKIIVPANNEKWTIKKDHVQRAFRLLQIQDGIRNSFRTMDAPPTTNTVVSTDMDHDGLVMAMALKHTEIARRILMKADLKEGTADSYTVHAKIIFKIFEKKEIQGSLKPSIKWFRAIAKNCPEVIGKFKEAEDVLEFSLPEEPNEDLETALQTFANTSVNSLKAGAGFKDARGGARAKRR